MGIRSRKEVRILLIGDRNVGKTSLILSLVSEEFPFDVPPRAEEITIPGDLTPEKVPTCIVDYSSVEQSDAQLELELRKADVVCVVYAVDDEDTLDSVTDHWLPFIERTLGFEHHTPIILVGNKVDLADYSTMDLVLPIMNDFEEIETCVECSAKNLKNISEMFYFAQKAVLHPSAPLWNYTEKDLTERCKKALTRVFKICDWDNDGLLNDVELGQFQRRCFSMDLESGTLESLKAVVQKNCSEGLVDGKLTLKGFLTLHGLFIQRGRHETTWTILRKFGYDDDLSLHKDYLFPQIKMPAAASVELSFAGYDFFTSIFEKYDRDKDKALSPQELVNLFSTCPVMAWGPDVYNTVPLNNHGYIGLQGYLSLWTLTTLLDTQKTLEHLAYMGYTFHAGEENQINALTIANERKVDLAKKQTNRNVYRCHVIGPRDAGKTTFCQGLLERSLQDIEGIKEEYLPRHVINTVQVYGQEKYLILQDIDVKSLTDMLSPIDLHCDVCCLVYDISNPRSFEFAARIFLRYFSDDSKVPVLIVGNKADMTAVRQDYILQPEAFCAKHRLPPPQFLSLATNTIKKDIYVKLATMAAFPNLRRLVHAMILKRPPHEWIGAFRHFRQLGLVASDTSSLFKFSLGVAFAALGGVLLLKYLRSAQTV